MTPPHPHLLGRRLLQPLPYKQASPLEEYFPKGKESRALSTCTLAAHMSSLEASVRGCEHEP